MTKRTTIGVPTTKTARLWDSAEDSDDDEDEDYGVEEEEDDEEEVEEEEDLFGRPPVRRGRRPYAPRPGRHAIIVDGARWRRRARYRR